MRQLAKFYYVAIAAGLAAGSGSLSAQNMHMFGGNNVAIEHDSSTPSPLNKTSFAAVNVDGGQQSVQVWIYNTDNQTDLAFTGGTTVTGTHAGDFSIVPPTGTLGIGAFVPVGITFNPSAAGVRTAVITIPNNTPGPKGSFSFAVSGEGTNGAPPTTADLGLVFEGKFTKSKLNVKQGLTSVKWKVTVVNEGPLASQGGIVRFYRSDDAFLSLTGDSFQSETLIAPLPAPLPGKKLKRKKVKFKGSFLQSTGFVFAVVELIPAVPTESDQVDNVISDSYGFPF